MEIKYHEKSKQFHLSNDYISYVIGLLPDGELGCFYYGKKIHDIESFPLQRVKNARPMSSGPSYNEEFSLEHALREYPAYGTGDYRIPAYEILQDNGSRVSKHEYKSHEIIKGKPYIAGMPSTYTNVTDEAMTLIIALEDIIAKTIIELHYTIWRDYPVICKHAKITNYGKEEVILTKALSMCMDFDNKDYQWIQFSGAWGRERQINIKPLSEGVTSIESTRGHSSANFNPFVILKRPNTDENQGEALALSFVYSGNFISSAEVDTFGKTRVLMGINPQWFEWTLTSNESFETPEVVITWSDMGLNTLSQTIHRLFNNNLIRGIYKNKPKPILINNWEATGPEFDENSILRIAKKAKEAGIELFVLDDGWFGKRNDDFSGLGDWYANTDKLPNGMSGLCKKINEIGLEFGIWIEPEMVNEDSDLYRSHPDWVLAVPERDRTLGRHQMVLDFSKSEVVEHIYKQISAVIRECSISYIKWDMNRSITECYSKDADRSAQGKVFHKYILGVYSLYEKLIGEFPNVLFESCASGGSRFDAGMLYYAPQGWCSDDTDAIERIRIQYGTSFGYPIGSIGSHISACPNQQTGRYTPIETRANVAYFGTFGYELDLNELSTEEFEKVKSQVAFAKQNREIIQCGDFYRLSSPFDENISAWMSVSKDKKEAVVGIYKILAEVNFALKRIKLKGLNPDWVYKDQFGNEYYGDHLMEIGIDVYDPDISWDEQGGDFTSKVIVLQQPND